MGDTKIQWTGKTWNPIRARNKATGKVGWFCEHVSEGCRNCYAEKMNVNTYFGNGLEYKPQSVDHLELFLDENILQQPLHWRKPTKIFPCSMTDLFGRWVKDEWVDRIFAVMSLAGKHTFQVLTKRPERMREYFSDPYHMNRTRGEVLSLDNMRAIREAAATWPLSNVWLGTSVEDQDTADERIPLLLQSPAAIRWISAEPLLGPVDLALWIGTYDCMGCGYRGFDSLQPTKAERVDGDGKCPQCGAVLEFGMAENNPNLTSLDWVVVGGESGGRAREFDTAWAREIIQQCKTADIPVFVKQLGAVVTVPHNNGVNVTSLNLKDKKGGNINEWPVDLRVREFPFVTEG